MGNCSGAARSNLGTPGPLDHPLHLRMSVDLSSFIDKWKQSAASERANKDPFLLDLREVLGVDKPGVATGDPERDRFALAGRPVSALGADEIASPFKGAQKPEIAAVLEALSALSILLSFETPQGRRWRAA